jgi:hypothetical protein
MRLEGQVIIRLWTGKTSTANSSQYVVAESDLCHRGLATNIGMPFKTPEEFFLGQTTEPAPKLFEPMSFVKPDLEEPGMSSRIWLSRYMRNQHCIFRKTPDFGNLLTGLRHRQTVHSQAST